MAARPVTVRPWPLPATARTTTGLTMTDDRPTDLLTIKEAMVLTGRSERSLRRWRQEGRLKAYPALEPGGSPLVSKADLMTAATAMAASAAVSVVDADRRPRSAVATAARSSAPMAMAAMEGWQRSVMALEREVEDLKVQREDLKAQREDMRAQRDDARKELDGVRKELADVRTRSAALERELTGGFAGLLKGKVRKRLGIDDEK